jgi:hypothetical protein
LIQIQLKNWIYSKKAFEDFAEEYEQFITAQQLGEGARLLLSAQRADVAVSSSIEFTSIVLKNLCPESETFPFSENRLEIYLSSETDFHLFLEKVTALEQIYEELCHLLNVSPQREPLKIVKIESGSVWTRLTGNQAVVTAIAGAISKAAHYVYRNHTKEDQLASIPNKVGTIESVLHLHDELKKRGIETRDLDEHIKIASVRVGNHLEKLFEGEEQIEVNGEVIALTPGGQLKLIEKKQVALIADTISTPTLLDNPQNSGSLG